MPRSVGEAAATGLESGFSMALNYNDRLRQQKRQDLYDQQQQEGVAIARQRQANTDTLSALNAQEAQLNQEAQAHQALTDSGSPPDAATQEDFTRRFQAVRSAKEAHLAKISGIDIGAVKKAGAADLQTLKTDGDINALKPGQFSRAVTTQTGRAPQDYVRNGDQPAPVEAAAADIMDGLKGGDQDRVIKGLNVMFAPELRKRIGRDSKHGGKIVGAEIVNVVPAPNSDPNDPHVIPTMRIYVNGGKAYNGPPIPGAPEGATGYYDAPPTEGMGTGDSAKVKTIGINEAMDFVGKQMHMVEVMNHPEALAKLQEDANAPEFNPNDYLRALTMAGGKAAEKTVTTTVIPAGGTAVQTTRDKRGNLTNTVIQGNAKPARAETIVEMAQRLANENGTTPQEEMKGLRPTGRPSLFEEAQQYAAENDIPVDQAVKLMQAGKAGAGGRAATGANPDDKVLGRQLQLLKEDRLEIEKRRDVAITEYKAEIQDATKAQRASAKAAHDKRMEGFDKESAALRQRIVKIQERMDGGTPAAPPPSGGGSEPWPDRTSPSPPPLTTGSPNLTNAIQADMQKTGTPQANIDIGGKKSTLSAPQRLRFDRQGNLIK